MISGSVDSHLEALIPLVLVHPDGTQQQIEAVVDTGFNGFLTLPPRQIESQAFPRLGRGRAVLADGSESVFEIHAATVLWDGQRRVVEVDATDTDVLIGMALLKGYSLEIHVVASGTVRIHEQSQ